MCVRCLKPQPGTVGLTVHAAITQEQNTSPEVHGGAPEARGLGTGDLGLTVLCTPHPAERGQHSQPEDQRLSCKGDTGNPKTCARKGAGVDRADGHVSQGLGQGGSLCPQSGVKKWPLP